MRSRTVIDRGYSADSRRRCPHLSARRSPRRGSDPARPRPSIDGGRYAPKRCVGRHGHGLRRRLPRRPRDAARGRALPRPRAAAAGSRRRCAPIDAARQRRPLGRARSRSTRSGRWECTVEAWIDLFATWRDELAAQGRAGQEDLSGELSEGAVLLRGAAARAEGDRPQAPIEHALTVLRDADAPPQRKYDAALAPELRRRRSSATPSATASTRLDKPLRSRSTACARASAPGTSSSRARGAASRASRSRSPQLAELGFDVLYLPPIHPIGVTNRKGRNNTLVAGPDDPGSPVGDRRHARAATTRSTPSSARVDDVRCAVRHRARARHRRRAGLRAQRVRRPPVADRAPRVVPPPPRRHAQVRREPAQEVPGHLQRQLGLRGLARPVGGVAATSSCSGSTLGVQGLPRRQPAHEAVPVLGVADRGGPQGRPRRDLPRRGVHPPRGHARARPSSASTSPTRTSPGRTRAGSSMEYVNELAHAEEREYFRPNFFPNTPDILAEYLVHGGPAAFDARLVLAGDAEPELRHLLRLRALRERAGPRGLGGVPRLREVRDQAAQRSTGRCCR